MCTYGTGLAVEDSVHMGIEKEKTRRHEVRSFVPEHVELSCRIFWILRKRLRLGAG